MAPKEADLRQYRGEPYLIPQNRLDDLRKEFMYWYFDQGGDDGNGDYQTNIQSSMPQIHKNFNFQLPFYGFRYNYTRVRLILFTHVFFFLNSVYFFIVVFYRCQLMGIWNLVTRHHIIVIH